MARAALLLIGGDDGLLQLTAPGAGERWLRTAVRLLEPPISSIWLDRHDPLVCAAGGPTGGWVSADGGNTWCPFTDAPVRCIIGWPAPERRIIAHLADGSCLEVAAGSGAVTALGSIGGLLAAGTAGPLGIDAIAVAHHTGGSGWTTTPAALPSMPRAAIGTPRGPWALTDAAVWSWRDAHWVHYAACPDAHLLAVLDGPPALVVIAGDALWRIAEDGAPDRVAATPDGSRFRALQAVPYHPDTLVAATASHVLWSRDRGTSWITLRDDLTGIRALASARLA